MHLRRPICRFGMCSTSTFPDRHRSIFIVGLMEPAQKLSRGILPGYRYSVRLAKRRCRLLDPTPNATDSGSIGAIRPPHPNRSDESNLGISEVTRNEPVRFARFDSRCRSYGGSDLMQERIWCRESWDKGRRTKWRSSPDKGAPTSCIAPPMASDPRSIATNPVLLINSITSCLASMSSPEPVSPDLRNWIRLDLKEA